ncbi:FkbM family methyltransferase [Paenochrobactrum pullorum]|uniref:FkbM family methyltransferase n=1 Tax=Paenochrobactrum pullorum TaxID=1324351 RepID=UPI0035BC8F09
MLISYAQNFEDIMLWRAFKNIKKGFYIDIGAWSPTKDSVTRCFYDAGWHGINIEPNPYYYRELKLQRKRDRNLKIAVSDYEGTATMFFVAGSGLSTLDPDFVTKYEAQGFNIKPQKVDVLTLPAIWIEYVPDHQEVHFLKVDVEGLEKAIIASHDWQKYRPWIVVVEATLPLSQIASHRDWEHVLLSNQYNLVYQDGLNRFYLAHEHSDLERFFDYPPNVFDNFMLASEAAYIKKNNKLLTEQKTLKKNLNAVNAKLNDLIQTLQLETTKSAKQQDDFESAKQHYETLISAKDDQITALYRSTSWRVTSPIRWIRLSIDKLSWQEWKHNGRFALQKCSFFIMQRPQIMRIFRTFFVRFPKVKDYLYRLIIGRPMSSQSTFRAEDMPVEKHELALGALNYRAKSIYHDLVRSSGHKGEL